MKPYGDNVMLCDIQYVKENRREGTPDVLYTVWKDLDTGNKFVDTQERPDIDLFFEKRSKRNHSYPKSYIFAQDADVVNVPYTKIIDSIIQDGGETTKARAKAIYNSRQYGQLQEFLKYPYVYGGDIDIRAYNMYRWRKEHEDIKVDLHIGFADIEVDFFKERGTFNVETCPVDLCTFIDGRNKRVYTFALVEQEYPMPDRLTCTDRQWEIHVKKKEFYDRRHQMEQDLMNNIDDFIKDLHDEFDEVYGSDFEYNLYFYNDEAKMIWHIFELIKMLKPDFLAYWNFVFDVDYIYKRAKVLGIDPMSLFTHPDFKGAKQAWFKIDKFHHAIKNKTDYFYNTGYTNHVCQMRIYAATRKNRSELRSYSLNYIGQKEMGDSKLDYSDVATIKTLAYVDYFKYVKYNIKDVLLQFGIERATHDIMNFYLTAIQCITPFDSVFKQTVKLRCCQYYFQRNGGMVPGMNINKTPFGEQEEPDEDDEEEDGFEGALVGDARLNAYMGQPIYGNRKSNNVFNAAIDMDMTAFYPSTINITNNEPSNLIFKVIIPADQFKPRGGKLPIHTISDVPLLKDKPSDFVGDVAKECLDNFYTGDVLTAGHKWFNLPTIENLYEKITEELDN